MLLGRSLCGMGEYIIDKSSWKIVELIIRRYPQNKEKYEQYISDIMFSSTAAGERIEGTTFSDDYTKPQSVTEAKALKMTSKYMQRLKKEIKAVELAYNSLSPEYQSVMRARFWTDQKKNTPYLQIKSVSYSERQMKRIVKKIIIQVGRYLGEVL